MNSEISEGFRIKRRELGARCRGTAAAAEVQAAGLTGWTYTKALREVVHGDTTWHPGS